MIRADRVRKARRTTRCNLCGGPIYVGRQIARLGKTWVHSQCAAQRIRDGTTNRNDSPHTDRKDTP